VLKRHINLFIKLFLIVLLALLTWLIISQGKAESVNIYTEKPIEPEVTLAEPTPIVKPTETLAPSPTPKPNKAKNNSLDKIKRWEEEYYYATKAWKFLRQKGFNQEVTCAIIGNMMIETSGGSLDLKPDIYSPDREYYGLCQWSKEYYLEAHGLSFEQQLNFLLETIMWEFDTFGENYKKNFKYEDFLAMTDPAEAALAFAKAYERCRPASYELRQEAALKAYEYFDFERP
jgi:hypothetical protein